MHMPASGLVSEVATRVVKRCVIVAPGGRGTPAAIAARGGNGRRDISGRIEALGEGGAGVPVSLLLEYERIWNPLSLHTIVTVDHMPLAFNGPARYPRGASHTNTCR
jgi:hypothetical protein